MSHPKYIFIIKSIMTKMTALLLFKHLHSIISVPVNLSCLHPLSKEKLECWCLWYYVHLSQCTSLAQPLTYAAWMMPDFTWLSLQTSHWCLSGGRHVSFASRSIEIYQKQSVNEKPKKGFYYPKMPVCISCRWKRNFNIQKGWTGKN